MVIIIYTLPISNFKKSALRSCATRMGTVFHLASLIISAGIK